MSQQNMISVKITDQDAAQIKAAISVLKEKLLPHLKSLKSDEKNNFLKMGDKSVAFVQKTYEYCNANPELAPKYLDTDEYAKDIKALELLRAFGAPLEQIAESLSDTLMLVGSDSMSTSLMFYHSVMNAMESNVPKAGTIYADLKKRFPGRPPKIADSEKK